MYLITGATGHIGNALVRVLRASGQKVRALILPGEDHESIQGLGVEEIEGNILDTSTILKAMDGVQDVFHLAGIISILPGNRNLLHQVNVKGTMNVIQAAIQAGIRRLVYTSSIHAIARTPHGVTIDERFPFDPNNPFGEYDRSKAEATILVKEAVEQGVDAVIVCPTGVIGPYDYRCSEMGSLILDCLKEKPQLYVEGAYDFVDVRDVAQGMLLANEQGKNGEVYILSGEQIQVHNLLDSVREISGKKFFTLKIPTMLAQFASNFTPYYYRLTHAKPRFTSYSLEVLKSNSIISHAKATREIGYQPRPLHETLSDTIDWFHKNVNNLVRY